MAETDTDVARGNRPQQRPAQRAAPKQPDRQAEHQPERTRTRQRSVNVAGPATHDSYISLENVPSDVSLEWKRFTAIGQEYPFYLESMRKQGFEPVNPQEHPDWVSLPPGYDATTVIVDGLILMERPTYLRDEARAEDRGAAQQQVTIAEQKLGRTPKDTMTRDFDGARPKIVKEVGRMVPMAIEE